MRFKKTEYPFKGRTAAEQGLVLLVLLLFMVIAILTRPESYTVYGAGVFVNGKLIVATETLQEAETAMESLKASYVPMDRRLLMSSYDMDVRARRVLVQNTDIRTAEEAFRVLKRGRQTAKPPVPFGIENPLCLAEMLVEQDLLIWDEDRVPYYNIYLTCIGTEALELSDTSKYCFYRYNYEPTGKIKSESYTAYRTWQVIETMRNGDVIGSVISHIRISSVADNQTAYKGRLFTREETASVDVRFMAPATLTVSSPFGDTRSETGSHTGADLWNPMSSPIRAAASGTVTNISTEGSYGNLIIINHGGNVESYYSHCDQMFTSVGDVVNAGDIIGTVGITGRVTGPHLHFEIRINGWPVDPILYVE